MVSTNHEQIIIIWNQMNMQDLETFINIKQKNESGNF